MHVATHIKNIQNTTINNNIEMRHDMLIDFSRCFTNRELKADTKRYPLECDQIPDSDYYGVLVLTRPNLLKSFNPQILVGFHVICQ